MRCVIKDKATPKTGGVTSHAHTTAASRFPPGLVSGGRGRAFYLMGGIWIDDPFGSAQDRFSIDYFRFYV